MTSPIPGMRQALPPTRLRQREVLDAQLTQCRRVDNSFTRERSRSPGGGRGTPLAHRRWGSDRCPAPSQRRSPSRRSFTNWQRPRPSSTGHPPPGVSTPAAWSTLCCGRRAPRPGRPSPPPADPTTRHEERDPRNGGHGRRGRQTTTARAGQSSATRCSPGPFVRELMFARASRGGDCGRLKGRDRARTSRQLA